MYAAAARHRRLRLRDQCDIAAPSAHRLQSRNIVTGSLTSRLPVLSSRKWPASSHDGSSKTLVVYAYFEDSHDIGFQNANFFVKHALHASADFIFILQGDAPKFRPTIPDERNIRIIQRDNTCMDLGAYGELFRSENGLATRYRKYIFINASVRGPFIPMWSHICWSDAFTSRLSDSVKVRPTLTDSDWLTFLSL
ncbi:hypothetical protein ANO11243_063400 [Dothideomycetidae sp. 11243]|nr:hypothetical protein ANO11243_063400 [fungal sp. No.11243]